MFLSMNCKFDVAYVDLYFFYNKRFDKNGGIERTILHTLGFNNRVLASQWAVLDYLLYNDRNHQTQ